jgi:signal transduction histidine kinase
MTQPTASKREELLDFWQHRERRLIAGAPFGLLGLCLIVDLFTRDGGFRHGGLVDLAAALATALVLAVIVAPDRRADLRTLHLESSLPRPLAVGAMLALVALSTVLVIQNSLYGFYAWTGYFWAYRLLWGNLRFVAVAVNAVPVAISQTGSGSYTSTGAIVALVAVWIVNTVVANVITWFGWIGDEREQRRAEEVTELTRANAALAESLRENAELHERLVAQARDAGVADERRRLAREIHDTLAQGLMGIITQLQAAQRGVENPAATRHIASAVELARQSLTEARRSVAALAPEQLVGARLPDAVSGVVESWSALNGVPVALTTTGEVRATPPEVELALLRTAQEALANVAKHAHAGRVGLTLSYMDDMVTLDVRDDGIGFDPGERRGPGGDGTRGGFGLGLMRERIEGVSGRLVVESEPASGTAISAAVPLTARPGAPAVRSATR